MVHERFDLDFWISRFSVNRLRDETGQISPYAGANAPAGPCFVALIEQYRALTYAHQPEIERIPADIFVWSRGEPVERAVTKTGGLPYWERTLPWPTSDSGKPLTFMAQISFVDSLDLVPSLPGEMLLLFTEAAPYFFQGQRYFDVLGEDESDTNLRFIWRNRTMQPLVQVQDIPAQDVDILPCYGSIHRTWDYPSVDGFAYPEIAHYVPPIWKETKIGGVCPQKEFESLEIGSYFCTQSSVRASPYPYPFLNVPGTLTYEEWEHNPVLTLGDVGFLNLFLLGRGEIRYTLHLN